MKYFKLFEEYLLLESENEAVVYHGGPEKLTNDNVKGVIFTTTDKEGALWYVDRASDEEGGWLMTMKVKLKNPLTITCKEDFLEKWAPLLKDANIKYEYKDLDGSWSFDCDEITDNGGYDTTNLLDLIYIKAFIEAAKKHKYDGIRTWDVLENGEIEVFIPFYKESITVLKSEKIKTH